MRLARIARLSAVTLLLAGGMTAATSSAAYADNLPDITSCIGQPIAEPLVPISTDPPSSGGTGRVLPDA
jgi:hypothetical protein